MPDIEHGKLQIMLRHCFIALICLFVLAVPMLPINAIAQTQKPTGLQKPSGAEGSGQLMVTVKEASGSLIAHPVKVTLRSPSQLINITRNTDKAAQAFFTSLPEGDYVVEVSAPGYRTVQQEASIGEKGEMAYIEFTLAPDPEHVEMQRAPAGPILAPKALKEMEKGMHAMQAERLGEAEKHFMRALQLAPYSADANYLIGVLRLRQQDAAQARERLEKAVALAPEHAAAWLALGESEFLLRDYPQAILALEHSASLKPNSWQAQWLQGACYFQQGEYGKAREHAEEALREGQEEAKRVRLLLGRAQAALGEREAALANLEQFLHEQPDAPEAAAVRKLVEVLRAPQSPGKVAVAAEMSATASVPSPNAPESGASAPIPRIAPVTETNWAPPDVDEEKPSVEAGVNCVLNEVMKATGAHVEELVENVNSFSATERMEQENLSPLGVRTSKKVRTFNYLASIRQIGSRALHVQEYRDGSDSMQMFPAHLGTMGLPMLALIFHPYYRDEYVFTCEGRGEWRGRPAWVVRYRQREHPMNEMRAYLSNGKAFPVRLKGWAWIDVESSEILAMEADIMRPLEEIHLLRDYQMIEYGPVESQKAKMQLWLPKSADWYCDIKGQRYHRRHSFSHFVLFSVEERQKIGKPRESASPENR